MYCRVFGLTFQSDRELPGLDRIQEPPVVDYNVRFDDNATSFKLLRREFHSPWYISPRRVKSGRTVVGVRKAADRRRFMFRFYDDVEFIIDRERQEILIGGLRRASLQAAIHHLVFSLPGFLLSLRKSLCFHGASVTWGEGAIALVGQSNFGKSVLSAYMAVRGIDVLSDDLVALDVIGNDIKVYHGYPWVSLRPESLHLLDAENLGSLGIGSQFSYLDETYVTSDLRRNGVSSQLNSMNLKAIYLLSPVDDPECRPVSEQVPRPQALMALMEAADRTHIPYPEFKPQEFSLIGSVVAAVPTYRLYYHLSADSLSAIGGHLIQPPDLRPER
jgi:hypothetical protein